MGLPFFLLAFLPTLASQSLTRTWLLGIIVKLSRLAFDAIRTEWGLVQLHNLVLCQAPSDERIGTSPNFVDDLIS